MKKMLVGKDRFALVDDDDYFSLREHKWNLSPTGYAMTIIGNKAVYMHRMILRLANGLESHHRNGNILDNRRANLRVCTHGQNMAARRMHKDNKVGYKGVTMEGSKFHAQICKDHIIYRLGNFNIAEDAARAYDKAARDLHGEYAKCNFPE